MINWLLCAFAQQILFLCILALTPLASLGVIGKLYMVDKLLAGEYLSMLQELFSLSTNEALTASGSCLLVWSVVYNNLPFKFIPSFVPVVGGVDRYFFKLAGLVGLSLLILAILV